MNGLWVIVDDYGCELMRGMKMEEEKNGGRGESLGVLFETCPASSPLPWFGFFDLGLDFPWVEVEVEVYEISSFLFETGQQIV